MLCIAGKIKQQVIRFYDSAGQNKFRWMMLILMRQSQTAISAWLRLHVAFDVTQWMSQENFNNSCSCSTSQIFHKDSWWWTLPLCRTAITMLRQGWDLGKASNKLVSAWRQHQLRDILTAATMLPILVCVNLIPRSQLKTKGCLVLGDRC